MTFLAVVAFGWWLGYIYATWLGSLYEPKQADETERSMDFFAPAAMSISDMDSFTERVLARLTPQQALIHSECQKCGESLKYAGWVEGSGYVPSAMVCMDWVKAAIEEELKAHWPIEPK